MNDKYKSVYVSHGTVSIYESGRMDEHMYSENDGWGINDGSEIDWFETTPNLIPYSEGT
jgi:hypothetical protein